MALWRELRRAGAVPLGQAAWAVPDLPAVHPVLQRLSDLASVGNGQLLVLSARGHAAADVDRLKQLYTAAREQEWTEWRADCARYLAELDKEEAVAKYTLAELEEEEQSLDRLRRWYRDLRARDLLASPPPSTPPPTSRSASSRFDAYAEHIYTAVGSHPLD